MNQMLTKNTKKAPVVMIGYSRQQTLELSLQNLSRCFDVADRDISLFLDAPYKPEHQQLTDALYVCACALKEKMLPHLRIVRRERNYGVPGNLISAVSETLNLYGRIIFFEDDVLVSRTFLRFMDEALEFYEKDKRIWCINGNSGPYVRIHRDYPYDVYLTPRNLPWGWATWKDRWEAVDFTIRDWPEKAQDTEFVRKVVAAGEELLPLLNGIYAGRVRTWDVQCTYYMLKHGLFSIEPKYRLTKTIGLGTKDAVNCRAGNASIECMKYYNFAPRLQSELCVDNQIMKSFCHAWSENKRVFWRLVRRLHRFVLSLGSRHDAPIDICS